MIILYALFLYVLLQVLGIFYLIMLIFRDYNSEVQEQVIIAHDT